MPADNINELREILNTGFTDQELLNLVSILFPKLDDDLIKSSHSTIVSGIVDYVTRNGEYDNVLEYIKNKRIYQYGLYYKLIGDKAFDRKDYNATTLGKYDKAINALEEHGGDKSSILEVKDKRKIVEITILQDQANAYKKSDNWGEAERVYRDLDRIDPENPQWRNEIQLANDEQTLAAHYEQAIEHIKQDEWSEAQKLLARIVAEKEIYRDAPKLLTEAIVKTGSQETIPSTQASYSEKKSKNNAKIFALIGGGVMFALIILWGIYSLTGSDDPLGDNTIPIAEVTDDGDEIIVPVSTRTEEPIEQSQTTLVIEEPTEIPTLTTIVEPTVTIATAEIATATETPESEVIFPQTAQEAHAQLIEKGEIVIGVPINGGVLSQTNEQGVYEGFEVDIAREFAKRWFGSEQNITIIPVTSPERIPFLEDGTVDLIVAALTRTDDRCTNYVECSQTYFKDGARLLVRRDSGIAGLCDLDGEFVAAVTGTTGADSVIANASFFCDENVRIGVLAQYSNRSSAINAVKNQEASAYTTDGVILTSFEDDLLVVVGDELSDEPYAVGARKGNTGLIQLVELTLQEMTRDETYREIYETWFRCTRAPFLIDLTYRATEAPSFIKDIDAPARDTLCVVKSTYTVQPGDNFFGIALEVFGDPALYPCIQEFNGIEDVRQLSVNRVLDIPARETCTVSNN